MKNKAIRIPILNDEYKVVVCWGTEKYIEKLGKEYWYDEKICLPGENRGICWEHTGLMPIIIIRGYPRTAEAIGTLAHEAYHAARAILRGIDEKYEPEEIVGHCVGAIVRTVLKSK